MDQLIFVLPPGADAVSGGNIYNSQLMRALQRNAPARAMSVDQWRKKLESGDPAIYFLDTLSLKEALAISGRMPGQRFVLIVHHLPSLEPDIDRRDEMLGVERAVLPLFDAFLSTSSFTTNWLGKRGYQAQKIMTVLPAPPAVRHTERTFEPSARALVVGNLIARKAIFELLEVVARRISPADRFAIDIVGRADLDARYAERCLELVANSDLLRERVTFAGPVPHEKIGDFYRKASLFLSAARMETFGMALQEARVYGLPILGLDRGNVRHQFTDGQNGLLFSSVSSLADGFLRLARDGAGMQELFDRAQTMRLRDSYDWDAAAARLLAELARCLGLLQ